YNSEEIAEILHKPSSTIRNQLARAKKILKRKLGDLTL
ncbi:RNA polymerase sigma factor, partial [Coprobacillus cateniformis]|nr:RNA polymerase sigma factor [Coprobacillus cateniformis]